MALPAQGQSPRMQALQNLSKQLPVANQRLAQSQQAARDIQLQQAVAKAPATASTTQTAQQTGATAAGQTGQESVARAQNMVQQGAQIGQLGLGEQQMTRSAQLASQQQAAQQQEMNNIQRFAQISEDSKRELFDKQLQFQRDEQGRAFFNERQLADYARLSAKSDEEFKDYAQRAEQLSKRKLETMEQAYRVAMQDLQQREAVAEQQRDQRAQKEIVEIRANIERQIAKERAKAANRGAMFQAGGTVLGAGAGALIAGPAGAAAGASIGGALGGVAATQET